MLSFVITLVLATSALAADRIAVSQSSANPAATPILLSTGLNTDVKFTLSQPIVCEASVTQECNVVVLLTNSDPNKVTINPCVVKWTSQDWFTAKTVNIKVNPNYNNIKGTDAVTITTAAATSPAAFYTGFNANDLLIKAANLPSSQCRATGDPHYTTLDGAYWHFYDGNSNSLSGNAVRPKTVVNFVKSTNPNRPFGSLLVQTQVRGYPATNCAIIGREGNDLVGVSVCSGKLFITTKFGNNPSTYPKIEVTGSTYTVYFTSGFWFRAETSASYANIYAQVPGFDSGFVGGMCGNFDGNAANDYNVYQTTLYSQLTLDQKVDLATEDLANWEPAANWAPPGSSGASGVGAGCVAPADGVLEPLLNNAAGADITAALQAAAAALAQAGGDVTFVNPPVSAQDATAACAAAWADSAMAAQCELAFTGAAGVFINKFARLAECQQDVLTLHDIGAANDMIVGLTVDCANHANGLNLAALDATLCLNGCNFHGSCSTIQGAPTCTCDAPYSGSDCSVNPTLPPKITGQYATAGDVCGSEGLPAALAVTGDNFIQGANLKCVVTNTITNAVTVTEAIFLGSTLVVCNLNVAAYKDLTAAVPINVQVTNNYLTAIPSNAVPFTFYCSDCQTAAGADKPNTCKINGKCHANGAVNPAQACQVCDAANNAWAVSLVNSHLCGPVFSAPTYASDIVCSAAAGQVVLTVPSAVNPLSGAAVTYSLEHSLLVNGASQIAAGARFFTVNSNGAIVTKVAINYNTLTGGMDYQAGNPLSYDGFFQIVAQDSAGNFAEANIVIGVKGKVAASGACENGNAVTSFSANVAEDAAVGTVVTTVTDVLANQQTFSLWFADINVNHPDSKFSVNAAGQVKVAGALNAAVQSSFHLQVQVTDASGLWYIADVYITVTAVANAPTDILLSQLSVPELPAGAAVGTLSVTDSDGGSYTYVVTGGNFEVVHGNQLQSVNRFQYDNGESTASVTITVTDVGCTPFTKTFTIQVTPVNEPPTNVQLLQGLGQPALTSVAENTVIGTVVGVVTASDIDSETVTCAVAWTTPYVANSELLFVLDNNNLLVNSDIDFETAPALSVVVQCSDDLGALSAQVTFFLSVIDVNDAPTVDFAQNDAIDEGLQGTVFIGTMTIIDVDSTIVTTVVAPGSKFQLQNIVTKIKGAGSKTTANLVAIAPLDFEADDNFVTVTATDSAGATTSSDFEIVVNDVNEAATGASISIPNGGEFVAERAPAGTVVAFITIADPDSTFSANSVSIIGGGGALTIGQQTSRRASTGTYQLVVANSAALTAPGVTFQLNVDGTILPAPGQPILSLPVLDSAMSLTFQLSGGANPLDELAPVGTTVGNLKLNNYDSNIAPVWSVNNALFEIVAAANGNAVLKIKSLGLNFETGANIALILSVSLPGLGSNLPANNNPITASPTLVLSNSLAEPPTVAWPTLAQYSTQSSAGTILGNFVATTNGVTFSIAPSPLNAIATVPLAFNGANLQVSGSVAANGNTLSYTVTATQAFNGATYAATRSYILSVTHACSIGTPCSNGLTCYNCGAKPAGVTFVSNVKFIKTTVANYASFCPTSTTKVYCSATAPPAAALASTNDASSGTVAASTVGAVVGVVGGVAALLVIIVVVVVARRRTSHVEFAAKDASSETISASNPAFVAGGLASPLDNPMYEWYQPTMTRKDCSAYLQSQGEGAFVIRESAATPGWHMLAVKTGDDVVHEKIRFTEDGMYELLPTDSASEQPKFPSLPALVEHYLTAQPDAPYVLAAPARAANYTLASTRGAPGAGYLFIEPSMA